MKAKYIKLLSLVAAMILSSCGPATYLNSEKEVISVGIEGGSGSIELSCDGDIELIYAPTWANIGLDGSTLSYEVGPNETKELRRDYVVVKSDDLSLALEIRQATEVSYLVMPKTQVYINKNGVGGKLKVITDGYDVKVECPEGISYKYDDSVLAFSSNGHTGRAKSYSAKVTCGDFEQKITIVQKGDICTTCGGRGRITCSNCDGEGGWGYYYYRSCDKCNGKGSIRCRTCGGTGKI